MAMENHLFFVGDTSSNGLFSIAMLVFRGVYIYKYIHHSRSRRRHCRLFGGQVLQFVYGGIH